MANPSLRRCAIYTRKSSEEGLEQDFNSLHAQREACEAFIKSQAGEGWRLIKTAYDDGGLSGGTMERPCAAAAAGGHPAGAGRCRGGLQGRPPDPLAGRLRQDGRGVRRTRGVVRRGHPAVQHHDLDGPAHAQRPALVRAVRARGDRRADPGQDRRLEEEGDVDGRHGTDRLRRGRAPLGRQPGEAATVREIYARYLELGSIRLLKQDLDRRGIVSKIRVSKAGIQSGGQSFSRGALHELLCNPIYVGEIRHRKDRHPGQHEAIVDRELWDKVQRLLCEQAAHPRGRPTDHGSESAHREAV